MPNNDVAESLPVMIVVWSFAGVISDNWESVHICYMFVLLGLVALTVLQGQSYVGMPKFGPTQLGCCTNGPWSDCRASPT